MDSVPLNEMRARNVLVLDLHEIVAGKLVSLIDRHAARDLFDARRILSIDGLDRSRIKAAGGACGRRDRRIMSVEVIKGDPRELRQQLAISLPRHRFSGKGVDEWIRETVVLCRDRFAFLFDLTVNERGFLDGVWTAAKSMPICSMSSLRYVIELGPCRCSPTGRFKEAVRGT